LEGEEDGSEVIDRKEEEEEQEVQEKKEERLEMQRCEVHDSNHRDGLDGFDEKETTNCYNWSSIPVHRRHKAARYKRKKQNRK